MNNETKTAAATQAAPVENKPAPDLRTLDGALDFLNYHPPNERQRTGHELINSAFQDLLGVVWDVIPEGPGRTVFVRDLNRVRMSANSAIANNGA